MTSRFYSCSKHICSTDHLAARAYACSRTHVNQGVVISTKHTRNRQTCRWIRVTWRKSSRLRSFSTTRGKDEAGRRKRDVRHSPCEPQASVQNEERICSGNPLLHDWRSSFGHQRRFHEEKILRPCPRWAYCKNQEPVCDPVHLILETWVCSSEVLWYCDQ